MAKKEGVTGWHSMRKEELIDALAKAARRRKRRGEELEPPTPKKSSTNGAMAARLTPAQRRAKSRIEALRSRLSNMKNISGDREQNGQEEDRVVLMVRDAYWLQAHWEVRPSSVERARTALGHNWHGAKPTLRVYRVLEDGSSALYREVEIHGGVNHWYIDVDEPPSQFRAELGYRGDNETFYCLCRSSKVATPVPGSADAVNGSWGDVAENADRIFAMSGGYSAEGTSMELQQLLEERLQRRMGRPTETRFGNGANGMQGDREELSFAIDAELVIYGATTPRAHVTVEGEPVKLRPDGTFAVRMHLPDRRQVVPVVASDPDGVEQRTIILGVERNTKELEPVVRDATKSNPYS
ncbi:hypothetical protein Pan181_25890 [Aeoliella mucimassa]|uniref:DUF4912 domain-containing protein n=2 Tax=Aeoliella mucimassa TaxID=2527972 RepID=A0A518ANT6_9BACT|nr:hypothetical protein Pan181_25890 [Aeoliella mucimassa]